MQHCDATKQKCKLYMALKCIVCIENSVLRACVHLKLLCLLDRARTRVIPTGRQLSLAISLLMGKNEKGYRSVSWGNNRMSKAWSCKLKSKAPHTLSLLSGSFFL